MFDDLIPSESKVMRCRHWTPLDPTIGAPVGACTNEVVHRRRDHLDSAERVQKKIQNFDIIKMGKNELYNVLKVRLNIIHTFNRL